MMKRRGQWANLRLVLFLFVGFRLSLLAFWPADQLARWSDYDYYYRVASWVDQGRLPYIHYWVEYPPLFSYLSLILYLLTSRYVTFATSLALVQLVFEVGSLVLLHRLARRVVGDVADYGARWADRVVWVYVMLFAPIATWWLSFDSLATFFLLLAIERWLAGRRLQSALAMGVGGLVKWFPILFLPVVVRFRRNWRESFGTVALVLLVVGGILGLLAVLSPAYTWASLRSLGSRASWQTIWALVDGNLGTGAYNADRLDPSAAALPQGNPARVPSWVTVLLFGMLYLWLWTRPLCDLRLGACGLRLLRFTTVTVLLFFLWSRGWSPQWLGTLVPLVLLCLPLERAALYLVVLTFINIAEWPVLLSRGLNQWLYLTVLLRTGILILLVVELWRRVRR